MLDDFNGHIFQRIGRNMNPFCDFLELRQNFLVYQDTLAILLVEELRHRLCAEFDNLIILVMQEIDIGCDGLLQYQSAVSGVVVFPAIAYCYS